MNVRDEFAGVGRDELLRALVDAREIASRRWRLLLDARHALVTLAAFARTAPGRLPECVTLALAVADKLGAE